MLAKSNFFVRSINAQICFCQAQLKAVYSDWIKETKKKSKQTIAEHLERLVRLTVNWVRYRNGAVLGKPDSVAKVNYLSCVFVSFDAQILKISELC